jgi:aquaporin Z
MSNDPRPETPEPPTPLEHAPSPAGASLGARLAAEGFGTFLLVFGLIGTALFASHRADDARAFAPGVVYLGASLAVGLTVVLGAYAFGPISGGHFNPAVTFGLAAAGRFPWNRVLGYVIAQVVGGVIATTLIVLVGLFGPVGWLPAAQDAGFASNGWGALSPGGFGMGAAMIVEALFTALFVVVILGVTHRTRGNPATAGIVIGLTLAVIHLATIPVDNTSVNPARSIATAIYGGGEALLQLWVFLVFPILGAVLAGFAYRALFDGTRD